MMQAAQGGLSAPLTSPKGLVTPPEDICAKMNG